MDEKIDILIKINMSGNLILDKVYFRATSINSVKTIMYNDKELIQQNKGLLNAYIFKEFGNNV